MENALDNNELARRFLLGSLSESERAEIEDASLAQDDVYQELLIAEDELIDAYVRGELPAPERALFERRFLASQADRERVEFAQWLFTSVAGQAAPVVSSVPDRSVSWWQYRFGRRPALGFAIAAALLVGVLGGLWFLADNQRTVPAPEQAKSVPATPAALPTPAANAEPQRLAIDETNSNLMPEQEAPQRTAPVIAVFTLVPGLVRAGDGAGPLVLPAAATEVRLRLTLEGEPSRKYRATISTPEGTKVWSRDIRNSTGSNHLTLAISAKLFKDGDYVIDLSARADGKWESAADYSFRIVKK